jgi:hypothetical protein
MDEVTAEWRKLHSEELHNCTHPQISLGRPSQDECSGQGMWYAWEWREKHKRFWWESLKERDHSEDEGVGERIGSEWILGRLAGGCGLDSTCSGQGPVAGCCECGDKPSGLCAIELVI